MHIKDHEIHPPCRLSLTVQFTEDILQAAYKHFSLFKIVGQGEA